MSRIVGRAAWLLVLMLGAGCGAGSTSPSLPPTGYPTEYVETADSHIEVSGRRVGDFGHVTFTGSLFAANGTEAIISITVPVRRLPGGSVECGGRTYDDAPFTSTVEGQATDGSIEVVGVGTADIVIKTHEGAFPALTGPPLCEMFSGSFLGTGGALDGESGEVRVLIDRDPLIMSLTLEATPSNAARTSPVTS